MKEKAIGIFDSGLGGLTAVKELINNAKREFRIFWRYEGVPYNKVKDDNEYAIQDIKFLLQHNIKMIIVVVER